MKLSTVTTGSAIVGIVTELPFLAHAVQHNSGPDTPFWDFVGDFVTKPEVTAGYAIVGLFDTMSRPWEVVLFFLASCATGALMFATVGAVIWLMVAAIRTRWSFRQRS